MRKIFAFIFVLTLIVFTFTACEGPKVLILNKADYVWPPPPEKPRIKLVDIIATSTDLRGVSTSEKLFGTETTFYLKKPHGIAADKRKVIYVSDTGLGLVHTINRQTGATGQVYTPAGFSQPLCLAYDDALDWLVIADAALNIVQVVDVGNGGKLVFTIGEDFKTFKRPVGVAIDSERGHIYVSDTVLQVVKVFDLKGNFIKDIGEPGYGPGQLYYPTGMAVDKKGRLYVVNQFNFRFDMFDSDGNFIKSIGEHGTRPGMFARPKDIAIDSEGHIYVTDAAFNNFQIFDEWGRIYLFVGYGGRMPGGFSNIWSIFIDKDDIIYTTDQTNRRIQLFQYVKHPDDPDEMLPPPEEKS